MRRHTKASRRAAFLRHVALPVRYASASTKAARSFMAALRATPMPVFAPTSHLGAIRVHITLGRVQ